MYFYFREIPTLAEKSKEDSKVIYKVYLVFHILGFLESFHYEVSYINFKIYCIIS